MKKIGQKLSVVAIVAGMLMLNLVLPSVAPSLTAYAAGDTALGQAESGADQVNPGARTDLLPIIKGILSTVFVVVGIIAAVVIIIGGINYALSQGDPGKIKKAKDTILYGIVGLVVSLLAFAIVQFVLDALQ